MKVLDVGCSDGYIAAWLRQEYDGDLTIDGLELYPEAVELARSRGINCKVGLAEDAPELFEPGTYDLVVAFEIIEHVPDVPGFLDQLERMLKPGGRVMISTPDGTFGTGNNPHHLRVYRSIDLADVCRRRGVLQDLLVGDDGIVVASYTPRRKLADVAIYTGPCWDTWGPSDIATRGLGGSETAAVRLAEQLAEIGFVVTVYGQVNEGAYRDVIFRDWRTFDPLEPRLAVISSRLPELFDRPVAAKHRLLWAHDIDFGDRLTAARLAPVDHVLVLSRWHEQHVAGRYPFARAKLTRIRNGVHLPYFEGDQPDRRQRVVYTSSPDRGLDVLLELWPRVREQVPDAELVYAYSPVYWRVAEQDPAVGAHAERVRELSAQPGVTPLRSLSQPDVAKLMRSSLVWAHPSYCTPADVPFHETSCIGAMEAQAAGCVVVASNWGALSETVGIGRLVSGPALSERWKRAFVREIVDGLTNPETQEWAQREGPEHAAGLGWVKVALQIGKLVA